MQDIPGAFYLWIVEQLFCDNKLVAGDAGDRRRAGRPRAHRLPAVPARRRARPHHAARAGLRRRRPCRTPGRGHREARQHGRAPRPVHGLRGAARPLAADPGRRLEHSRRNADTAAAKSRARNQPERKRPAIPAPYACVSGVCAPAGPGTRRSEDERDTGSHRGSPATLRGAEKRTADAVEELVKSNAFGELLARSTENIMGLTRIGFDAADLVVRNLRLAGKPDITSLGRQLARTEDKLERCCRRSSACRSSSSRAERASTVERHAPPPAHAPSRPPSEPRRAAGPRPGRSHRVRQHPADAGRRRDRRHAPRTSCGPTARRPCTATAARSAPSRCRSCSCSR